MKYLCESCKHMLGKPRTYHYMDSLGIERSLTNAVRIRCDAAAKRTWIEREPVEKQCGCPMYMKKKR